MSIHDGHRDRLKRRFLQEGLDNFDEIHALELLLFYAIPQGDVSPLAHSLLAEFGSIAGVLQASRTDLLMVKGVGQHAATLLQMIPAICRYYLVHRTSQEEILETVEACGDYLLPRFFGARDEQVYALCLDARCKALACKLLGTGSINASGVPIRRIVEFALSTGATSLVLAHNHPSGIAFPSGEDIDATNRLATALDSVGVILADHIIVADDDYISLLQSDFYKRPESAPQSKCADCTSDSQWRMP